MLIGCSTQCGPNDRPQCPRGPTVSLRFPLYFFLFGIVHSDTVGTNIRKTHEKRNKCHGGNHAGFCHDKSWKHDVKVSQQYTTAKYVWSTLSPIDDLKLVGYQPKGRLNAPRSCYHTIAHCHFYRCKFKTFHHLKVHGYTSKG